MPKTHMDKVTLTPEQIKNWRNILLLRVGPYALMMPEEEVQMFRDKMQADVNVLAEELELEEEHERSN